MVIRIAQKVESASLIVHKLATINLVLCASEKYLREYGKPQQPEDLSNHLCLHYGYFNSSPYWNLSKEEEQKVIKGRLYSNNGEVLAQGAVSGLGITLLPEFIIKEYLQAQQLIRILPEYSAPNLSLFLLYPINRHLSTKVKLLTDFLQNCCN